MNKTLSELAEIKIIFVFRDKTPPLSEDGNVFVFNIRDLVSNWPFYVNGLPRAFVDESKLADAVHIGDILMPGRGQTFPARRYGGEIGPILPAGQIYDIRVKDENIVSSKYLEWYLNRANTQQVIKNNLTGTTIPALNKSALQKLLVPVPAFATQNKIIELKTLFNERIKIRENLNRLEMQQLDSICHKLLVNDVGPHE